MQKRTPKKIYRVTTHYYIDCEDKMSVLAIFIVGGTEMFWGWVDGLPGDAMETSWLDLLVVTGIPLSRIEEAVSNSESTQDINRRLGEKHHTGYQ